MNKELKDLVSQWHILNHKLRRSLEEYLTELLQKNNNDISWDDIDMPEFISICYNGGNHPEYASNVYSNVHGIHLNEVDSYITVHIDDDDEYLLSELSTAEILEIVEYINGYKEELNIK